MNITSFQNQHRWLSNFFPSIVSFASGTYPTVEHAYQASKTRDAKQRDQIRLTATPGQAKRLGRYVTLRDDWDEVKLIIMHNLVWVKFTRHPTLTQLLLDTGGVKLIEGNNWGDTYWGMCNGIGQNQMGRILMNIRDKLNRGDHL